MGVVACGELGSGQHGKQSWEQLTPCEHNSSPQLPTLAKLQLAPQSQIKHARSVEYPAVISIIAHMHYFYLEFSAHLLDNLETKAHD